MTIETGADCLGEVKLPKTHLRAAMCSALLSTALSPALAQTHVTIVDGRQIATKAPPPHGEHGMAVVRSYTDRVEQPAFVVRERSFLPGSRLGEHLLTHDQIFYLLEGEADMQIEGVVRNLTPGDMVYAYDYSYIQLRPLGDKPARFLMMWPGRENNPPALSPIMVDETMVARDEPTPHGAVGMSRSFDIFPPTPGHEVELRKRTYLPGARLGRHPINRDTMFYTLSGEGTLGVNGKPIVLKPGIAAYVPRRNEIEVAQTGSEPLSLLMMWHKAQMNTAPKPAVLVNDRSIAVEEPPHGGQGMSRVSRLTEQAEGRKLELRKRVLMPGSAMAPYVIPRDQAFLVLEGEGELTVNGASRPFRKDQFAYLEAGSEFSLTQKGAAPLSVAMMWAVGGDRLPEGDLGAWSDRVLEQDLSWYASPPARRLADTVLKYQSPEGGWPKSVDLSVEPASPGAIPKAGDGRANTFDNDATTVPMAFLAKMVTATGDGGYRDAFNRGLDYVFDAQYPKGGWPQFYPLRDGYYSNATFNDDAMVRILQILRDISLGDPSYRFVDAARRQKAKRALDAGVAMILRTQIVQDGKRTVWAAQYDPQTEKPAWARRFEPPSLSGNESVGIARFLMSLQPTPSIIAAVEGAVAWFRVHKIEDARIETFVDAAGQQDRRMIHEVGAGPIWARFYELDTNRPVFMGRQSVAHYNLADIEQERRGGYHYMGTWPRELIERDYPAWRAKTDRPLAAR